MSNAATLYLGACARVDRTGGLAPFELPAHHLVTHAFMAGQTGSGNTGLNLVLGGGGAVGRRAGADASSRFAAERA